MRHVSLVVAAAFVFLLAGLVTANQGDKQKDKGKEAKITKVDAKKGTVTVKMKDKDGKEVEKTFRLAEDVFMADSTGRVATIDVFRSGDWVLVVEREGKLKELRKTKEKNNTGGKDKGQ